MLGINTLSFFLIFIFTLFCFTILYWFWHTLTWICHGCTWVPNPEPPSHLLPRIISPNHPHAPAPSILYTVSNIDWQFVSYLIVYMFQCHSPKSSHPLPLPQSLKVRSIHLCLFCRRFCIQFSRVCEEIVSSEPCGLRSGFFFWPLICSAFRYFCLLGTFSQYLCSPPLPVIFPSLFLLELWFLGRPNQEGNTGFSSCSAPT